MGSLAPPILHLFNSPAGQRPHTGLALKPAQTTPAHLPERLKLQITREGGWGEGILPCPGRSSEGRRQQRTPRKVLQHSPPFPLGEGRGLLPASSTAAPSWRTTQDKTFGERASASPASGNSPTARALTPSSAPPRARRRSGSAQLRLGATTQVGNVLAPAPPLAPTDRPPGPPGPVPAPSARFLPRCAGAPGQTLRRGA